VSSAGRDIDAASIPGEHAAPFALLDAAAEGAAANGKPAYGFADWMRAACVHSALRVLMLLCLANSAILRGLARLIPRRKVCPDGASTATAQHAN
jgi:hypothetical protein